jgi:hypothetical protein
VGRETAVALEELGRAHVLLALSGVAEASGRGAVGHLTLTDEYAVLASTPAADEGLHERKGGWLMRVLIATHLCSLRRLLTPTKSGQQVPDTGKEDTEFSTGMVEGDGGIHRIIPPTGQKQP